MAELTRRRLLATGVPLVGAGAALLHAGRGGQAAAMPTHGEHAGGGHAAFRDGMTVDHGGNGFDPHAILRDFDRGTTTRTASGPAERSRRACSRR